MSDDYNAMQDCGPPDALPDMGMALYAWPCKAFEMSDVDVSDYLWVWTSPWSWYDDFEYEMWPL